MAVAAGRWCWFVEQHVRSVDLLLQRVALGARNVFVSAGERKCSLAVIEQRRPPLVAVVASCAIIHPRSKLLTMRIFVAFRALGGSAGELHVDERHFHIGGLMAVSARNSSMRTGQRK